MSLRLVDSHCHLDLLDGGDADVNGYLETARQRGVGLFLTVCVDLDRLPRLLALAETHDTVYTSVGVHPCGRALRQVPAAELAHLAAHPRVLAIGETGLDAPCLRGDDDPEWQRQRFREQVRAARLAGKPLIVHSRGAPKETARLLREEGAEQIGGIIHCFTEDQAAASAFLDLGFHLSFSGILTFRNAGELRGLAKRLPQWCLLVETDCPYLAPEPHRGKQNQPAYVREVAQCLAEVRGEPLERVAAYTTENFLRLFPQAA